MALLHISKVISSHELSGRLRADMITSNEPFDILFNAASRDSTLSMWNLFEVMFFSIFRINLASSRLSSISSRFNEGSIVLPSHSIIE